MVCTTLTRQKQKKSSQEQQQNKEHRHNKATATTDERGEKNHAHSMIKKWNQYHNLTSNIWHPIYNE